MNKLTFNIACRTGIRREAFNARNTQAFVQAKGHRLTEHGLKQFNTITSFPSDAAITALGETKAWPFPQLFKGKAVTLLCFSDAIYTYNGSTFTIVSTKDASDTTGSTSKSITAGKDWHFIDLYDSWMLLNTACVIFKTKWSEHIFVQDAVTVNTGCVHKEGRVLLGGFNTSDYDSLVDWPAFWATYAADRPEQAALLTSDNPGANWVWWSSYFAPDMLHLFWQDILIHQSLEASDTGYGASSPFMLEIEQLNQSGLRPIPYASAIHGMLPLGPGVAVYGDSGVAILNPYGDTYGLVHPSGMPTTLSLMTGADCRTAFAGNMQRHLFIDEDGEVWNIAGNYEAERLGWKAEIAALDSDSIMVVHEPLYDEFYIGDGSGDAFLVNRQGLTRAPWTPTTVHSTGASTLKGVNFPLTGNAAAAYTTEKFRGDSGGVEVISRVVVIGLNHASDGWEVSLKYRVRPQDDFTTSDWFPVDAQGGVDFGYPFLEAQISLRSDDRTKVTLEDVLVLTEPLNNPSMAHWIRASAPSAATE